MYAVHPCDSKEREHTFQISTNQRIFYLHSDTEDQLNYWTLGLSSFIKKSGTQDRLVLKKVEEREKEKEKEKGKEKGFFCFTLCSYDLSFSFNSFN